MWQKCNLGLTITNLRVQTVIAESFLSVLKFSVFLPATMFVVVRLQYHEWMASIIARSLGCLLQFWYVIPIILFLYSNSSSISVGVSITTGTILSYQRALACWGKSKLEARHQQEITNPITKRLSWAVPTPCRAATTPTFLLSPPLRFCWE